MALNMKGPQDKIREYVAEIQRHEAAIQVLQAKISGIVRGELNPKSTANEATETTKQFLQE